MNPKCVLSTVCGRSRLVRILLAANKPRFSISLSVFITTTALFISALRFDSRAAEVLYSFTGGTNGMNPRGVLLQGTDGAFYGTTEQGGAYGYGSIFKITTNGILTPLFSFNKTNGANPYGGLVYGQDANFFGTTFGGGASGLGTIFRFTTNGVHTLLLSLSSTSSSADGAAPSAGLVLGSDGDLYGTTWSGFSPGSFDSTYGKVFKFHVNAGANSGTMTSVHRFPGSLATGAGPICDLVQGSDGYFYGTTFSGGSVGGGSGTVFRVNSSGTFSILAAFNGTNGAGPYAGLTFGNDGKLYGTTAQGGTNALGTVFQISTNGLLTSLHSFNGTNGAAPFGELTLGPDGNFYGTTSRGGLTGNGTVFQVTTNGALTVLYSFTGDQGAYPYAGLRFGSDGNLYGNTYNGFVFMVTTNGELTNLGSFNNGDGVNPYATMVPGPDGKLYGTTFQGGSHGHGTIYTVSTNGSVAILTSFAGTNGASPYSGVTFAADGAIYGTTVFGSRVPKGNGTIYRANTNGVVTGIASFTGTNGANPYGSVVLASGGRIYGTTRLGGNSNYGVIFSANTNGSISRLYSLTISSGNYPYAGLTTGLDGQLYGVTWVNGATCFKITTNGVFTGLPLPALSSYAYGTLAASADGVSFNGTCEKNSGFGFGGVYRITTNGSSIPLFSFNNGNGAYPRSDLTWGADGNLYGTTFQGGTFNRGTVFKITTNGTMTSLLGFDGTNGMSPNASVRLAGDGNFYGATTYGGDFNAGVIYRIRARPFLLSQPASQTNLAGSNISLSVIVDGVPPFAYQWLKEGTPLTDGGNISGATTNTLLLNNLSAADTASYSIIVSNAFGAVTSSSAALQVITPPSISVGDGDFGFFTDGFGFSITSSIGSVLLLQSSTNLIDWTSLATLTNQSGVVIFVDPNTNEACQFYRAVQQ